MEPLDISFGMFCYNIFTRTHVGFTRYHKTVLDPIVGDEVVRVVNAWVNPSVIGRCLFHEVV